MVAKAHGGESWFEKTALQTDLKVEMADKVVLQGRLLFETSGGRARIDLTNGDTVVYDGADAWVSPPEAKIAKARFHVRTWPYFVAVPWKLNDPGCHLEKKGKAKLRGEEFDTARLTFDRGVGDTPDDWYKVYCSPEDHTLCALVYIVTYGVDAPTASKEPHAVTYDEFQEIDGLKVPSKLVMWAWDESKGLVGDRVGTATFSDTKFVQPNADAFAKPSEARKDELPK